MARLLDISFLLDLLGGHNAAVAMAQLLDSEGEAVGISAPVRAEFLDGAYLVGGSYLARATQLLAGRDVVPFDKE